MRSVQELSRLAAALGGLPVLGCLEGSPAAQAGMRYGDVLLAVDGALTHTWDDFLEARGRTRQRFIARIFRDGIELDLDIELRASERTPGELLAAVVEQQIFGGPDDKVDPVDKERN